MRIVGAQERTLTRGEASDAPGGVEQETKGKTLEEIEAIFKTGGKGE